MSSNQQLEDIKVKEVQRDTPKYKIKSYVMFLILIAIILLVLIFLGSFGNDLFGLMVFLAIFLIPVAIIFRNKLPNILPDFITNSLFEIDESEGNYQPVYNISKKNTQMALIFGVSVLIGGAVFLIIKYRKQIPDKMCFFKIMSSLICLIFAGIMLSNLTGEELSITDSSEESEESEDS